MPNHFRKVAPSTIAIFPLPDVILFPGTFLPLHIFEPRYRLMIEYCSESDDEIAIAPFQSGWNQRKEKDPVIEPVFGWGKIVQKDYLPDGRSNIIVEGLGLLELVNYRSLEPFRIADVKEYPRNKPNREGSDFVEVFQDIIHLTKRIILTEGAPDAFMTMLQDIHKYKHPIDFLASVISYNFPIRQKILLEKDEYRRALLLRELLQNINLKE
jgi:ATP-dependent Lon protease